MDGKAYGRCDNQAGGASVQNFSDSSGKPCRANTQEVIMHHHMPRGLRSRDHSSSNALRCLAVVIVAEHV